MRAAVAHLDGRHESVGETLTRFALRLLGVAAEPQVTISGSDWSYRVDFVVDGDLVIEFDGSKVGLPAEQRRGLGKGDANADLGQPGEVGRVEGIQTLSTHLAGAVTAQQPVMEDQAHFAGCGRMSRQL